MTTPRDLAYILPKIIDLIPDEEVEFINALNRVLDNLAYKAPELRTSPECWGKFIQILLRFVPILEKEWHIQLNNIISNT